MKSIIDKILTYNSLSIAGLAKNTGKTETLNYVLKNLRCCSSKIAVTSIGVDGETIDAVTATAKPEILVFPSMLFTTTERHYKMSRLTSEILDISTQNTPLGRLLTAKAHSCGKVLLSGPSDTTSLKEVITKNNILGANITIVDGALSRLSQASPCITDAVILATGAALSANIKQIVRHTKYICDLVNLTTIDNCFLQKLSVINKGMYAIDKEGNIFDLGIHSALSLNSETVIALPKNTIMLFVAGAITDKLLSYLKMQTYIKDILLVVRDFTKIFASLETYLAFLQKGGQIKVLYQTKLLALTVNPVAPQGYVLNSNEIQNALKEVIDVPIYDIKMLKE